MSANEVVKKNISGMQVIKTLQLLMEDNYTMSELIEKLNKKEKEPIFNNSVLSKYINTCRYSGVEVLKIHNKYFVTKLPFGLDLSNNDLKLLSNLQKLAVERISTNANKIFLNFITRLNKYSNKNIIKVENKTIEEVFDVFEEAINEQRYIRLMLRTKVVMDCQAISLVDYKGKRCFKVLHNKKEKNIAIDRINGIELLGKIFATEQYANRTVVFKLTGELAKRYTLREHEQETGRNLPESIIITNYGEDKDELISRLLRYDKDCEILSPQDYRDEMKKMLRDMLANYGE